VTKPRIYDITVPIENGMPVWPGDPPVRLEQVAAIAAGANANVSSLACGVHVGTHVDAPHHFIDGAATVEQLPLEALVGRAYVADLRRAEVIDADALQKAGIPPRTERLLLRTRNSEFWKRGERTFQTNFVGVDAAGAAWLVGRKIRLVAVDYLSVAPYRNSRPTHEILLRAGIVILEGVDLSRVPPGRYHLTCLPMKLVGSDGAPARAILAADGGRRA
jgi:arylformamidase